MKRKKGNPRAKHNQEGRSGESQIAENLKRIEQVAKRSLSVLFPKFREDIKGAHKLKTDHCLRGNDGSGDGYGKVDVQQGTRLAVKLGHSVETDEA